MELKTIEKLIALVKDRPPIYGPRPKRGKKKHQKLLDGLWTEIAVEMNFSVRECKLKWTTLRNCYARLLREERCHKVKKRHWHLKNDMNFLRGHIQPYNEIRARSSRRTHSKRTRPSAIKVPSSNTSIDENSTTQLLTEPEVKDQKEYSTTTTTTTTITTDSFQNQSIQDFTIIEEPTEQFTNNWQQEQFPEDNDTLNCCPVIKLNPFTLTDKIIEPTGPIESTEDTSQSQPKNKEEQSEANNLFLRSLLPDLNKLPDRKQRIFKRKVLETLEFLFDESEFEVPRDENHSRSCQITKSNYSIQQQHHVAILTDKFIQKIEPQSP